MRFMRKRCMWLATEEGYNWSEALWRTWGPVAAVTFVALVGLANAIRLVLCYGSRKKGEHT